MAMEQMIEEELCAAILAKLEEIGKKLDDTNQKLEMNAQLSCVSKSSDQHASASSSTSPTSSPPRDAALVASLATTKLPPTTPTKCSMAGLYQAAHVMESESATMTSAPLSASSTPLSLLGAVLDIPHVGPEFGLVTSAIPHVSPEFGLVTSARCSPQGSCSDKRVPASMSRPKTHTPPYVVAYLFDNHRVLLDNIFTNTNINTVHSVEADLLWFKTGVCNIQKVFEVPVSNMMERPIPGPSFKFNQQGEFVQWKPPWPPLVQFVNAKHHQYELKIQPAMVGKMFQIRNNEVEVFNGLSRPGLPVQITHNNWPLILSISKSEVVKVSLADAEGMHTFNFIYDKQFLLELDDSEKNIRADILVLYPWPPPSLLYVLSNGVHLFLMLWPWFRTYCARLLLKSGILSVVFPSRCLDEYQEDGVCWKDQSELPQLLCVRYLPICNISKLYELLQIV